MAEQTRDRETELLELGVDQGYCEVALAHAKARGDAEAVARIEAQLAEIQAQIEAHSA